MRSKFQAIRDSMKLLYQVDRWAFLMSTSTGIIESLFYPAFLLIVWKGFSLILAGGSIHDLFRQGLLLLVALFGLLAIQHLLSIANQTASNILQAESSQQINARIISKMSEIPYRLFEENDFQARYGLVISQASYRPSMLVQTFISSISSLVSALGVAITLLALAPLLVVLLLVLIPLIAVETRFHRKTLELQVDSSPDLFRMTYLSQKSIDATWQRDIRVHNSSILGKEYRTLGKRYLSKLKQLLRRFQVIRSGIGIGVAAIITLATGAAFWFISQSSGGLAEAAILLPALYLALTEGEAFSSSWGSLVECLGYIKQVFDFLNQSFDKTEPAPALLALPTRSTVDMLPSAAISLQLHNVSYKYPQSEKVALSEISYTFYRGTIAIVGPNGAGKSTLVKLLTGLLEPTAGRISAHLPGGISLPPEKLHKAVLFQEPSHLYLTIRQNITMRFDKMPEEEERIYDALKQAGLGKVVEGLPDGIDTLVGAGFGGQIDLSGGQWQRLALARLIYQDAPLIILDEPVASLDPQGERAVFELFAQLAQSRIIIFTTHRYDSIPSNTQIVVLVDGIISESGTHEELLQHQHHYWSLYMSEVRDRAVPELASRAGKRMHTTNGQTNPGMEEFALPPRSTSLKTSSTPNLVPQFVTSVSNGHGDLPPPSNSFKDPALANSTLNLSSTPPTSPSPPVPASTRNGGPFITKKRMAFLFILLLLFAATTIGALFALAHSNTKTAASVNPVVGHVYFVSSGKLYVNNDQGINDELLIDLHHVAAPAPGDSYYAWLLGDENLSENSWIALGPVSVSQGNVHFLYAGDQAHSNLLSDMSRFVLTEGASNTQPENPLLDQSSWRYFSEIYQAPSSSDPNHFTMLDHLRHLLVQAPELKVLGLPGGLSIWTMRNVQEIAKWALSAKEHWETQNVPSIRQQLVNILYYLDGECTQQADLQGLPTGTPLLPENRTIAHIAHFALLNPCVQEEEAQAEPLKQVFHHVPHNYVDHLLFHMAGVIQSPGATGSLHTLGLQINRAINNMKTWLEQVHEDAEQLLHMTNTQLSQLSAFEVLGDLETQARYAFAGRTDPVSGEMQQGATGIYDNVQRLATSDVTAYSSR